MPNPIVHVEILGKDPVALQGFYGSAFDWEVDSSRPQVDGYALVRTGCEMGAGGDIGPALGDEQRVRFYVEVPDLDVALQRATALGATVVDLPYRFPGGPRVARFVDPEGNLVGLVSDRPHDVYAGEMGDLTHRP